MVKGDRKNYLTMVTDSFNEGKRKYAIFVCECGNVKKLRIDHVVCGNTKSCGCKAKYLQSLIKHHYTHGATAGGKSRLYNIYQKMKARCYNPNYPETRYYMERGITICEEWRKDFETFRRWALENGYANNLTIDRINVNKGYSPDNCRWATFKEQSRNRRSNMLISHNGKTQLLVEWCEELKLPYKTIEMRILRGWEPQKALIEPIKKQK